MRPISLIVRKFHPSFFFRIFGGQRVRWSEHKIPVINTVSTYTRKFYRMHSAENFSFFYDQSSWIFIVVRSRLKNFISVIFTTPTDSKTFLMALSSSLFHRVLLNRWQNNTVSVSVRSRPDRRNEIRIKRVLRAWCRETLPFSTSRCSMNCLFVY